MSKTDIQPSSDDLEKQSGKAANETTTCDTPESISGTLSRLNLTASVCIISGCKEEKNKHMLRCNKCKHMIHYKCTRLPAYQLYHFVNTKGYRNMNALLVQATYLIIY